MEKYVQNFTKNSSGIYILTTPTWDFSGNFCLVIHTLLEHNNTHPYVGSHGTFIAIITILILNFRFVIFRTK